MSKKTINSWLVDSTIILNNHSIDSARLDCLIILENTLQLDRSKILAQQDMVLSDNIFYLLNKKIAQRSLGKPVAYITNNASFYGTDFYVDERTLIPRPESELIVDMALEIINNQKKIIKKKEIHSKYSKVNTEAIFSPIIKVVDVGTGSGAIGISISLNSTNTTVDLVDISPKALQVAKINVGKKTTKNRLVESNLLNNCPSDYDLVVANLPYVPLLYPVSKAALHEPYNALYAVDDGLYYYKELFTYIVDVVKKPLYIIIEKMPYLDIKLEKFVSYLPIKTVTKTPFVNLYYFDQQYYKSTI